MLQENLMEALLLDFAGLNVLALVNSHAAAALQYGIERDFTNKSEQVILYDMGATSTECALVEFSSFRVKEGGSWKTYGCGFRSSVHLAVLLNEPLGLACRLLCADSLYRGLSFR